MEAERRPGVRRRTQEERSATTRERVIQAAIDCIVEEGLHNTTAARLVARSGVTWGAIAHQFGDKDSVLFAVVERNAEVYRSLLEAALETSGHTIPERVDALIDVTWKYVNEPAAFAYYQLLIHSRISSNAKSIGQQEDVSYRQMKIVWNEFFGEFAIPRLQLDTARNLTLGTLQGLSLARLITPQRSTFEHEIAALKRCVVQILLSES